MALSDPGHAGLPANGLLGQAGLNKTPKRPSTTTFKWFATASGAAKFNGTSWTKYTSQLPSIDVYAVGVAPDGKKWFVTVAGASKFDGSNWTTYNSQNGMPLKGTVI